MLTVYNIVLQCVSTRPNCFSLPLARFDAVLSSCTSVVTSAVKVCFQIVGLANMPWIPPKWMTGGFAWFLDKGMYSAPRWSMHQHHCAFFGCLFETS